MIYLASPYSHKNKNVIYQRYAITENVTANALIKGEVIYSPVVHCHELANKYDIPTTFDFWQSYNFGMLRLASSVYVLMIDGYDTSIGVAGEVEMAEKLGIPVKYIKEDHFGSIDGTNYEI